MESLLLVEKKGVGEHLARLDCLDFPTRLDEILKQLEDMGEATQSLNKCLFVVIVFIVYCGIFSVGLGQQNITIIS